MRSVNLCVSLAIVILAVGSGSSTLQDDSVFRSPVNGDINSAQTLGFNRPAYGQVHAGIDLRTNDRIVVATAPGTVTKVSRLCALNHQHGKGRGCTDLGLGNAVIIEHELEWGGRVYSLYGHLETIDPGVEEGRWIAGGQEIGKMGASAYGNLYWDWDKNQPTTADKAIIHLHFEIKTEGVLHAPKDSTLVGYVPAGRNPYDYGYHDPYAYFGKRRVKTGGVRPGDRTRPPDPPLRGRLAILSLSPSTIAASTAPYDAELSLSGSGFTNVRYVTFTWSGAVRGSATWYKGTSDWNNKVTLSSDASMTLRPRVVEPNATWSGTVTWTVTLRDTRGATASTTFTVSYSPKPQPGGRSQGQSQTPAGAVIDPAVAKIIVPDVTKIGFTHGTRAYEKIHPGIDIWTKDDAMERTYPVRAFADGEVIKIGKGSPDTRTMDYGYWVIIKHPANLTPDSGGKPFYTYYQHLRLDKGLTVSEGERVTAGQLLGYVGKANTISHVHFEIRYFKERFCPDLKVPNNIYVSREEWEDERGQWKEVTRNWDDPIKWLKKYPNGIGAEGVRGTNPRAEDVAAQIKDFARQYQIPSVIIAAVMSKESDWRQFDPKGNPLLGPTGDIGIMQINPTGTAIAFDLEKVKWNWRYNLEIGCRILKHKFGLSAIDTPSPYDDWNDTRPEILENWYYAVAWYSGGDYQYVRDVWGRIKSQPDPTGIYFPNVPNLGDPQSLRGFPSTIKTQFNVDWARATPDQLIAAGVYSLQILKSKGQRIHEWDFVENKPIDITHTIPSIEEPPPPSRPGAVTLTLYVREGSASGPVIAGAQVTGRDGAGNSFSQTTNASGYVILTGAPGTWSFSVSKPGYRSESWTQSITETATRTAFLQKEGSRLTFTDLRPPSITTSESTLVARLEATGTNFTNVTQVTFTWSGPDSGTSTWNRGDSRWNAGVTVNSDTSMTLRPQVLSNETGTQSKTWTWTVTLRDTSGATASRTFTVTYNPSRTDVTLTLYVREGSASGPVIVGAQVTGRDGAGNSFSQTTNASGYVTLTGAPGTWSFSVSKPGYRSESWTQSITETATRTVFLQKEGSRLTFTDLRPPSITTSESTLVARLEATGTNFTNVTQVTFTWSGPDSGTSTWNRGDSRWNAGVTVNSDTSMTLRPQVLSNETGTQSKTWTWTVTLRDTSGATASRTFTVTYTGQSSRVSLSSLTPTTIRVNTAPYDATLSLSGSGFSNVSRVTFSWSGAVSGSATWERGTSVWDSKVTVHSDTSMTLRPRVVESNPTWSGTVTWTVTLRDTSGATASGTFTVIYERATTSIRDGNWEIYVMNAGGSGLRNLTNHRNGYRPSFSPAGWVGIAERTLSVGVLCAFGVHFHTRRVRAK